MSTETGLAQADLMLEEADGKWSLYAHVSESALSIADLRLGHHGHVQDSLLPVDTQYSLRLLGQEVVSADDTTRTAQIVDSVDALSGVISHFDLEKNQRIFHGRFRELRLSSLRIGDDVRLGMKLEIKRPENVTDHQVSATATTVMRSVARAMKYQIPDGKFSKRKYDALIDDLVWVGYDTNRGVTITTNPVGSCSLDTDGNWYEPDSEYIELFQHNLYTHAQQLLCLVGAVAVTQAETLVK